MEEREELFLQKIKNILTKPYFSTFSNMGVDESDTQNKVLSLVYGEPIKTGVNPYVPSNMNIYDKSGRLLYNENINTKYWEERVYNSDGERVFYENSKGFWLKREYDENGEVVYYEDSSGNVIDKRPNTINESYDSSFIDRVIGLLDKPYFKTLDTIGIDDKELIEDIFNTMYNDKVDLEYANNYRSIDSSRGKLLYIEYHDLSTIYWTRWEYDSDGNKTYVEDSEGIWDKYKYDVNGNMIYHENSDGEWTKREFDNEGRETYIEFSDGGWIKKYYDDEGNMAYYEDSEG